MMKGNGMLYHASGDARERWFHASGDARQRRAGAACGFDARKRHAAATHGSDVSNNAKPC
jgi:hypothetical protein